MKIKSILTEIDNILPDKNKELIVENRASHVIVSANNVMQLLQKKFLNAIRTGKIERFSNALKRLENAD